jgi:hypothetical protein
MNSNTIAITDFSDARELSNDATSAVRTALAFCRENRVQKLVFPNADYHFRPDRATEEYLFISNNDEGLKRIAFPIFGFDGLEIDGRGSEFFFHGAILPFVILHSQRVSLRNFHIDWTRTFHNEGAILAAGDGYVDLRIAPEFPYKIQHGKILFLCEHGETSGFCNILEFDSSRRETAFLAYDNHGIGSRYGAEEIGSGEVRIHADFAKPLPQPGNVLILDDERRDCPGITIIDGSGIHIDGVTLYHAGGMGVIAQTSRDIRLQTVRVTTRPGSNRMVSTTADATHFVNCSGTIELNSCHFEYMMDDPTNVHGIYGSIVAHPDPCAIEVKLRHHQQFGVDIAAPGDLLEFVSSRTLLTFHQSTVISARRLNKELTQFTFAEPLPVGLCLGDAVANLSRTPDLTIRNTVTRCNRARGFLISTPGRVLIEENFFHNPGAAILIAGDVNHWFESGAVRNVVIRRNRFENCNYGVWGCAAIDVHPEIESGDSSSYHRNITIEENTFVAFDRRIVRARCVDGLAIRRNLVEHSAAYPPQHQDAGLFDVSGCANVTIEDNQMR